MKLNSPANTSRTIDDQSSLFLCRIVLNEVFDFGQLAILHS